ncbi:MAG: hypothetical protein O2897_05135, partial [bacterium]|nr:hypothetical protein [bacterium]
MKSRKFLIVVFLLFSNLVFSSQPEIFVWQGNSFLGAGDFVGVNLSGDGKISVGSNAKVVTSELSGPVVKLLADNNDILYVATIAPARIWRIEKQKAPVIIFETEKPIISSMAFVNTHQLAISVGPEGGIYLIDILKKVAPIYIPIKEVNLVMDMAVSKEKIYLVGGGETGKLLQLSLAESKVSILASVTENLLRSIMLDKTNAAEVIYLGSGAKGTVYRFNNNKLFALYEGKGEVVALAKDANGNIFSAIVDGQNQSSGESASNTDASTAILSQVVKISPKGEVATLWLSSRLSVQSMILDAHDKNLLIGTGARAVLLQLPTQVGFNPTFLWNQRDSSQISALYKTNLNKIYLGTAAKSAIYQWNSPELSKEAVYISPVFNMGRIARFGSVQLNGLETVPNFIKIYARVGNTVVPDQTWSEFKPMNKKGQFINLPFASFNQIKLEWNLDVKLARNFNVEQIRFSYLAFNQAPQVDMIHILSVGQELVLNQNESPLSVPVTLDQSAFTENIGHATIYAPFMSSFPKASLVKKVGKRSIYAWAHDPDQDLLRYQFTLENVTSNKKNQSQIIKSWTTEPFVSFDSFQLA